MSTNGNSNTLHQVNATTFTTQLQRVRPRIEDYLTSKETRDQQSLSAVLYDLPCTDMGNSIRLAARYGDQMRYVHEQKAFYVWDGQRWDEDKTHAVTRWAKNAADHLYHEAFIASQNGDKPQAEALSLWAKRSQQKNLLDSMISLSKSEQGISIQINDLDTNDYLFNCANGTMNLETMTLKPHDPRDLITKLSPAAYDPDATAEEWLKFIHKVMRTDDDMKTFLQDLCGCGLVGKQLDDILTIHYGPGGCGKGVFAETFKYVLGDYAGTAPSETFLAKQNEGISNDLAGLVGVRWLAASETDEGRRLKEALVKAMTGGDTLRVRFLHKEFFDLHPKFVPFLFTNHKPVISGTDSGIWRRVKLIPWKHEFEKDPENKGKTEVMAQFRSEASGILNWALAGYIHRMESKLIVVPDAVKEDVASYRKDSDVLGEFLEDHCITTEKDAEVTKTALYEKYCDWAENVAGQDKVSTSNKFSGKLKERNDIPWLSEKKVGSVRSWIGIRLRTNDDDIIEQADAQPDPAPSQPSLPKPPDRACHKCGQRCWYYDATFEIFINGCGK